MWTHVGRGVSEDRMPGSVRPFADFRLPAGRHGIPPEQVAESQRWRLLGAAAEVMAERGCARTTSAGVARRARVSSSAFYEHFDNVAECLLAAHEMAADCVEDIVSAACGGGGEWSDRLWTAIDAALDFLAAEPALAHLLGAEAPAGLSTIATAHERLVERLAKLLRSGRELHGAAAPELPAGAERRLVDGVLTLLSDRVRAGEAAQLPALAPELAAIPRIPPYSVSQWSHRNMVSPTRSIGCRLETLSRLRLAPTFFLLVPRIQAVLTVTMRLLLAPSPRTRDSHFADEAVGRTVPHGADRDRSTPVWIAPSR